MAKSKLPYPSQLAGWSPFKSKGGPPPDPPAIGRAPQGDNPRFPQVGPKAVSPPAGGYQSIIDTRPPINEGQKMRVFATITPSILPPGLGKSNTSIQAFSRALTDNTNSALRNSTSQFEQEFLNQAQKSRAEDMLGQRQNAMDLYRLLSSGATYAADMFTHYDQGTKDLKQARYTELWNEEAKRTAMVLRFVGSFI